MLNVSDQSESNKETKVGDSSDSDVVHKLESLAGHLKKTDTANVTNIDKLLSTSLESLDLASFSELKKDLSEIKNLYAQIEKQRDPNEKWERIISTGKTQVVRQFCNTRSAVVGDDEDNCMSNTDCIVA